MLKGIVFIEESKSQPVRAFFIFDLAYPNVSAVTLLLQDTWDTCLQSQSLISAILLLDHSDKNIEYYELHVLIFSELLLLRCKKRKEMESLDSVQ